MKKSIFLTLITTLLLTIGTLALADHHLVFISNILKVDDTDCAVELTLSGDDQDAFVADDNITFDTTQVATMESFLDDINAADGANDDGDTILFGSDTFAASHGIDIDVTFEDTSCEILDNDTVVTYFIDGDNSTDDIDTDDFAGFGNNTAITKSSASATAELVDLDEDTTTVTNNAGGAATLGTDSTSITSTLTSCSLGGGASSTTTVAGILVAGILLLAIYRGNLKRV